MSSSTTSISENGAAGGTAMEAATPWFQATRASLEMTTAFGGEALRFARMRFDRNREAAAQMAKCASWPEILELQMSWAAGAVQDYIGEGSELFAAITRAGNGHAQQPRAQEPQAEELHKAADRSRPEPVAAPARSRAAARQAEGELGAA
jgi:hypothetical protein